MSLDVTTTSERRASLSDVVYVVMNGLTNATFADYVCSNLTSQTITITAIFLQVPDLSVMPLFELPECVYSSSFNVSSFTAQRVIVRGNATFPNPFVRLFGALSPNTTTFLAPYSVMLTSTGEKAALSWDRMFEALPNLTILELEGVDLSLSSLPPRFNPSLVIIYLGYCSLRGTIPSTLFELYDTFGSQFQLELFDNGLTGTIPETLFPANASSGLAAFSLSLHSNLLNGTIPLGFLGHDFPAVTSFNVRLDSNRLEGPLSNLLELSVLNPSLSALYVQIGANPGLTGSIPRWLSSNCNTNFFYLIAPGCSLTGSIPNYMLGDIGCNTLEARVYIDLSNNQLSGSISPELWNLNPASTAYFTTFSMNFSNNHLSGDVPAALFDTLSMMHVTSENPPGFLSFSGNLLTGSLPSRLPPVDLSILKSMTVDFSNNPISGSIPPNFLPSIVSDLSATTIDAAYYIELGNTSISGALVVPDLSMASGMRLFLNASNANLSSFSISPGVFSPLTSLDISHNLRLTANLQELIRNSHLERLSAAHTNIGGNVPTSIEFGAIELAWLDLSYTQLDFCGGDRSPWSFSVLDFCNLNATSASNCQELYPTKCTFSAVPPPIASPTGCPLSTRPSPEFVCIGSSWTLVGSVNVTVLVIPAGATQTVITGNLSSSTVVINGLGSVLIVTGCVDSNLTITIELTPGDLETIGSDGKLQKLLELRSNATCNSTLSSVAVNTHVRGDTCKKVSVTKQESAGSLSGLFRVDKSTCQRWWIILVSVLCGAVVVAVVIIIIVWKVHTSSNAKQHRQRLHQEQ